MHSDSNFLQTTSILHKKALFAALVLLAVMGSFVLGQLSSFQDVSEDKSKGVSEVPAKCQDELALAQKDASSCYSDTAQLLGNSTQDYDYKTFGVYSQLLEGSQVSVAKYRYRQAVVVEKRIEKDGWSVQVNHIEGEAGHIGHFSSFLLFNADRIIARDIPTFNGYENFSLHPTKVSEIIKSWTEDDKVVTENELTFFFRPNYSFDRNLGVKAMLYSHESPFGASIFVQVTQDFNQVVLDGRVDNPIYLETKEELRQKIETFEIRF